MGWGARWEFVVVDRQLPLLHHNSLKWSAIQFITGGCGKKEEKIFLVAVRNPDKERLLPFHPTFTTPAAKLIILIFLFND